MIIIEAAALVVTFLPTFVSSTPATAILRTLS
jgi:hypothetical protein